MSSPRLLSPRRPASADGELLKARQWLTASRRSRSCLPTRARSRRLPRKSVSICVSFSVPYGTFQVYPIRLRSIVPTYSHRSRGSPKHAPSSQSLDTSLTPLPNTNGMINQRPVDGRRAVARSRARRRQQRAPLRLLPLSLFFYRRPPVSTSERRAIRTVRCSFEKDYRGRQV